VRSSARNAEAVWTACQAEGIACLCGLEITTREELHALALFDTPAAALSMTEQVYAWMPARFNVPELFGEQPVVNAQDQVVAPAVCADRAHGPRSSGTGTVAGWSLSGSPY